MGTKQVQVNFLIIADDGVSANIAINVGGIPKWTGALASTNTTIPGPTTPDNLPYSVAEFDLAIDNIVPGSGEPTTNEDITMTITGGTAIFKYMSANYSQYGQEVEPPTKPATYLPGTNTIFVNANPTAQPTWNGIPLYERMNFADGVNGPMLFEPGEVLAFPVGIPKYSS